MQKYMLFLLKALYKSKIFVSYVNRTLILDNKEFDFGETAF